MVRRSTLDRSPNSTEHGLDYEPRTERTEPDGIGRPRRPRTWSGGGGRWLMWTLRVVVWGILLLVGFRGVQAILHDETQQAPAAPAAAGTQATGFPVSQADAYALEFGQVYLNYSPQNAQQRANQLSEFLPPGSDPQLGWNGKGSSKLQSEQVAGTDVRDAHHAVVTLLARVNGQLMQLGVPIYAASGGLIVSGPPAWLPGPSRATLPTTAPTESDAATQAVLSNQLPAFFQAYASGNEVTLGRFLAPGTSLTGLGGTVEYHSIAAINVPPGGSTRQITATVVWSVPARGAGGQAVKGGEPAQLQVSYALTMVEQNGTWYVRDINASTESPGAP
jgi:Conjugative transposon protein TcpC